MTELRGEEAKGRAADHPQWLEAIRGQTALVEGEHLDATGTVTDVDAGHVIVECDQDGWDDGEARLVTVSAFAPDALYRIVGSATAAGRTITCETDAMIERIQRRRWPRKRLDLAVTLCPVESGSHMEGVPGRTIDVSVGGLCVETLRPFESGEDLMVILRLPDRTTLVAGASTVGAEDVGDGWRYRMAFRDLDDDDSARLAALTEA